MKEWQNNFKNHLRFLFLARLTVYISMKVKNTPDLVWQIQCTVDFTPCVIFYRFVAAPNSPPMYVICTEIREIKSLSGSRLNRPVRGFVPQLIFCLRRIDIRTLYLPVSFSFLNRFKIWMDSFDQKFNTISEKYAFFLAKCLKWGVGVLFMPKVSPSKAHCTCASGSFFYIAPRWF